VRCVLEAVEIVHYMLYVRYVMRCVPEVLGGCAEGGGGCGRGCGEGGGGCSEGGGGCGEDS